MYRVQISCIRDLLVAYLQALKPWSTFLSTHSYMTERLSLSKSHFRGTLASWPCARFCQKRALEGYIRKKQLCNLMSKYRKHLFWPFHSFILVADFKEFNQDKATAAQLLQSCPTLCNPMDCSPSGSSVHGILQQEYWSGLPCSPPGYLPDPGIEPASLKSSALVGRFFTTSATWEASPR